MTSSDGEISGELSREDMMEISFRQSLSEDDHNLYRRIAGAWIDLGLQGCETCEFASIVNAHIAPVEPVWGMINIVGKPAHYAIELNSLKRPYEQNPDPSLSRQDKFNPNKLFVQLLRIGIPEEEFEVVCSAFSKCIGCDSALQTTGRNRTFEEKLAIFEAEKNQD